MCKDIHIVPPLRRFGNIVVNLADVCRANLETGEVLMASGEKFDIPPTVLKCWFPDVTDWKPLHDKGAI